MLKIKTKIFPGDIVKYQGVRCLVVKRFQDETFNPGDIILDLNECETIYSCYFPSESEVELIGRGETLVFRIKRIPWKEDQTKILNVYERKI